MHLAKPPGVQAVQALTHGCPGDNPLAMQYQDFQVQRRALLTGHSHQAWPDCAKQGLIDAYQDAAAHVDDKWERAMKKAKRVAKGYARCLDDPSGAYVLGQNVHELFLRWLSALPAYQDAKALAKRQPLLSTHGEFHSLRRQLHRWQEYDLPIEQVPHGPSCATALVQALRTRPRGHYGAVLVSAVGFMNGLWVQGLDELAKTAQEHQTPLLIDAYHAVNVFPFSVQTLGLHDTFIVGGGYKYCQLGEGVCFLRIPQGFAARPGITGWFAEFELRDSVNAKDQKVRYPRGPAAFAGSTYDPTSHYRAAAVFDFFEELQLTPKLLSAINQRQIARLQDNFRALHQPQKRIALHHDATDVKRAGFLALKTPYAQRLSEQLRAYEVYTDARQDILRFGPAPYLSDAQLDQSMQALAACLAAISD